MRSEEICDVYISRNIIPRNVRSMQHA